MMDTKKNIPKPLFKTDDGEDIYMGDKYYWVHADRVIPETAGGMSRDAICYKDKAKAIAFLEETIERFSRKDVRTILEAVKDMKGAALIEEMKKQFGL